MKQLIFCLLLATSVQAQPNTISGQVIRVLDGDTFELLLNSTKIRCRLVEIDAPELSQPFGSQSGDSLRFLLLNQQIICQPIAHDVYQRLLVKILEINNQPVVLDSILVSRGLAWSVKGWSKQGYNADNTPIQAQARWFSRGLWKCPNPIPPWLWRHFNPSNRRKFNTCK